MNELFISLSLFDASHYFEIIVTNMSYFYIFLFMVIESSFIPFPSEIIVPPAAYLACQTSRSLTFHGQNVAIPDINIFAVVLVATAGAIVGALINYGLSLWIGRPIVYRFADSRIGHACLINREKVDKAERYFDTHGAVSTFVGRLIPAVRQLISIPAGLSKMNIWRFIIFREVQQLPFARRTYPAADLCAVYRMERLQAQESHNKRQLRVSKMIVAPSILSADFNNLGRDTRMVNNSAAGLIHIDVMDGVFVPNISFGFPVIKAVSKIAEKPLDVHLMIVDPQRYISQVRDCGAEIMNVHQEACTHLHRTVEAIKAAGMKAAVTLNPATPVETLRDIIAELHMVLLMSVDPGFGGQKFIPTTIGKIRRLRTLIAETGSSALIEIDGGITLENAPSVSAAGADIIVAGNTVFSAQNPAETIRRLSEA